MHDPFQSYQSLGAFNGGLTPFGLPYGGQQIPALHPALSINPFAAIYAFGGYGIHPHLQQLQQLYQLQQLQQLPLQQLMQGQGQPQGIGGQQNPIFQHALTQGWPNPMLSQQGWPQEQFGYPLAPQSLIGGGQIHPLAAQLALRGLTGGGISPWGY